MFLQNSLKSLVTPFQVNSSKFFSTTAVSNARLYRYVTKRQVKKIPELQEGDIITPSFVKIPQQRSPYPAYPYGESNIYKQSNRGLYGGQFVHFGNQVSEMRNKSRRKWSPNVIVKKLWSEALGSLIRTKMTARVLRTITKEGGLDNYLVKDKSARIKELGPFGWRLRYDVLKAQELNAKKLKKNYETVSDSTGAEKKVYFTAEYKGQPVKLTVGRRRLIKELFPVVQLNTPGELTFSKFNETHKKAPVNELLAEMEKFNISIDSLVLN
ncbi:hypothetical protein BVG19_g1995 [[Candida] boidinii]|nr:hypothetical protein BVG19_g1995 [[Candida] boidinii]OWB49404.1 hypothetical protein B5S27_g945 [[Candida] boidinii]